MIHNEHLRDASETYEIRYYQSNSDLAIHVYITDGEAVVFPTLHNLVRWVYFGERDQTLEHFRVGESRLSGLYDTGLYNYYSLKDYVFGEDID
jgi:hypothetical protein